MSAARRPDTPPAMPGQNPQPRHAARGRILLATLAGLFALGLLLAALVLWLNLRGEDEAASAATPAAAMTGGAAQIERGRYLALAGNCAGCHSTRGAPAMSGGREIETPFGSVFTTNLTPDPATGIGQWSADDFWRAMHHGRSRDGRLLYPAFPYPNYTRVSREDSDAILAWLRTLVPVNAPRREHTLRFPYGTQAALAVWRALYFRAGSGASAEPPPASLAPAQQAEWRRGAYLVQALGHCTACHSPRNAWGAVDEGLDFAGAQLPNQGWYAPSLTDAAQAGVAPWTREDVVRLLRDGRNAQASVTGPMAEVVYRSTQYLMPADLEAIALYLQSLPQHAAPARERPGPRDARQMEAGARIYDQSCAYCHGERGQGEPDAYPPLAGNRAVSLEPPVNLVRIVRQGGFLPSTAGNPRPHGMPPFDEVLDDAQIAAVLTYIRASWGNDATPVTPQQARRQ